MNPLFVKIITFFASLPGIKQLLNLHFPGLPEVKLSEVVLSFFRSLSSSRINMRAAAVSFDFFMALFPSIIFLFTLTAYLPIANFDQLLLETIHDVLPDYTYKTIEQPLPILFLFSAMDCFHSVLSLPCFTQPMEPLLLSSRSTLYHSYKTVALIGKSDSLH